MGLDKLKKPILDKAREIILYEGDVYPTIFFTLKQKIVGMVPIGVFIKYAETAPEIYKFRVATYLIGTATRMSGRRLDRDFDAILTLVSSWSVVTKTEEERRELQEWIISGKTLAQHPKRIENLVLSYSEGVGKHSAISIPFFRTPDGPVFEAPEEGVMEVESVVLDNFWHGYNLEPPEI